MLQKLNKKHGAFTLVEIMFVVAIIGLLAAIALPNFLRARKRAQASKIIEDLRQIDAAIDMYAIENNKTGGSAVAWEDLQNYLKKGTVLYASGGKDLFGLSYGDGTGNTNGSFVVDSIPVVNTTTYGKLSDVAPASFWSPYK